MLPYIVPLRKQTSLTTLLGGSKRAVSQQQTRHTPALSHSLVERNMQPNTSSRWEDRLLTSFLCGGKKKAVVHYSLEPTNPPYQVPLLKQTAL